MTTTQITSCCAWDLADGFKISWISFGSGVWSYSYSLTTAQGDVSYWIMAVSPTFTTDNISDIGGARLQGEITTYGASDSNPGIPGNIFGIKWNGNSGNVTFESGRAPIWGDFYAKDGTAGDLGENFAYNANFGSDPTAAITDFAGWIPTPDTIGGPPRKWFPSQPQFCCWEPLRSGCSSASGNVSLPEPNCFRWAH